MTSECDVLDKNLRGLFEYYPSLSLTVKRVESKESDWSVVGFKKETVRGRSNCAERETVK